MNGSRKHSTIPAPWAWILLALSPVFFLIPITHDAAWQMWIGRQIAHGANLYTDIVEVNPPLWFWLAAPLATAAEVLKVPSLAVLVTFFLLGIALSTALVQTVAPRGFPLWAALAAMLLPVQHFGQREHFLLIFSIPYVLLIAAREREDAISTKTALLIGFLAAIAFALKPHFAILPIVLEVWAWRLRKVRPETTALAVTAILYAVAIAIFEQDYITSTLPLVTSAYGSFSSMDAQSIFRTVLPFGFALPLLATARNETAAFTVASLTFYLVFLLQAKGWDYQSVPAHGTLFVALILAARGSAVRKALVFAAITLILIANLRLYRTPREFLIDVPTGTSFAALSVSPRAAWPMVEKRNLRWPLRYLSLWMAPKVKPEILNDLACNPPDLLLIDDRDVNFSAQAMPILEYYARVGGDARIALHKRVERPERPRDCRTVY